MNTRPTVTTVTIRARDVVAGDVIEVRPVRGTGRPAWRTVHSIRRNKYSLTMSFVDGGSVARFGENDPVALQVMSGSVVEVK